MKGFKKYLALILGAVMIFALAACGGGGSEESADAGADAGGEADVAAAYNKILEGLNSEAADTDEELVVAMSPDFAPMEFVDLSRSGEDQYVGYDVLLAKYIANPLGKKLVIKPMAFDAVMTAVQTGNVDEGYIKEEGTPEEVFDHPKDPRLQDFLSKVL